MNTRRKTAIHNAARRGAAWLDKTMPGWSRSVRRRTLNMESGCFCILGQIDGAPDLGYDSDSCDGCGYEHAVRQLALTERETVWLGFITPDYSEREDISVEQIDAEFAELTAAWRDELKSRPR